MYHVFEYDFVSKKIFSKAVLSTEDYAAAHDKAHELAMQWCEDEYPAEIEGVTVKGDKAIGKAIGLAGNSDFGALIVELIRGPK